MKNLQTISILGLAVLALATVANAESFGIATWFTPANKQQRSTPTRHDDNDRRDNDRRGSDRHGAYRPDFDRTDSTRQIRERIALCDARIAQLADLQNREQDQKNRLQAMLRRIERASYDRPVRASEITIILQDGGPIQIR